MSDTSTGSAQVVTRSAGSRLGTDWKKGVCPREVSDIAGRASYRRGNTTRTDYPA